MTKRTLCSGLGALAALMVGHGDGAHAAPPSRPAAVARCQTGQLAIAPDDGEGGVGHLAIIFLIHNRSGRICSLYGYPGAQLLNGNDQPLPTRLTWGSGYLNGNPPRRLVLLAPGTDAYVALEWTHIPTPGQSCPTASFVRITPPNASGSTIVWAGQGGIDACGGALTASPIEPAQFGFGVVPTHERGVVTARG